MEAKFCYLEDSIESGGFMSVLQASVGGRRSGVKGMKYGSFAAQFITGWQALWSAHTPLTLEVGV